MHFRRAREASWSEREPLGPKLRLTVEGKTHTVVPARSMRYLGFYLDPKLSFREHVRFYTTRASSTIASLRMLGNSCRGLSPKDKRRLYISNVLPVLTYGAQLWWRPGWKGRRWILHSLQKAQNKAARWITGGFRTTPVGALEMAAGLFPAQHQVDKLMKKACLRTHTLHTGHPTRAQLPRVRWPISQRNLCAPMPLGGPGRQSRETPMNFIADAGEACTETFDVLHDECRPGDRIRDLFSHQIYMHKDVVGGVKAPPKADRGALDRWVRDKLKPYVAHLEEDPSCILVFTDGSQKRLGLETLNVAAGAAWTVVRNGAARGGRFGCGKATPYDAEMAALARGLNEAVRGLPDSVSDIHVFADNQAALASILAAGSGPAQMLSVAACTTARAWLGQSENRCIHLHWVPGHQGVHWNCVVDREAGLATAEQSNQVSFAMARQDITAKAYAAWRADMERPNYRGHNNMLHRSQFDRCKHTSANWFLRTAGRDNVLFARLVRFTSGHFPHGAFRERFNFNGNKQCWCGAAGVESRDHMWFDCELWVRKHKPPDDEYGGQPRAGRPRNALDLRPPTPPGLSPAEHRQQLWREAPVNIDDVADFLQRNPAVGTFQWLELVDRAFADRADGLGETINTVKASLHSSTRKAAFDRWAQTHLGAPLQTFHETYARAAARRIAERFEMHSVDDQLSLLVEFGLSPRAARATLRGRPFSPPTSAPGV